MKQRIITGLIGGSLVILLLFLRDTVVFNCIIALITLVSVYEILVATHYVKNRVLIGCGLLFAAVVPFFQLTGFMPVGLTICCAFILATLCVLLHGHRTIELKEVSFVFMMSLLIPFSMSTMLYLNVASVYFPQRYDQIDGLFFVLLAFGGAWMGDIGAYFIGSFFGKHKLAPVISPKKTVEGAIGGVLTTVVFFTLLGLVWEFAVLRQDGGVQWVWLVISAVACSIVGMIGDLAFSCIKRACYIKDYGHIIPGHGGMLDRFDSVILVSPFLFLLVQYIPFIVRTAV